MINIHGRKNLKIHCCRKFVWGGTELFLVQGISSILRNIPLMKRIRKIKCALLNRILSWKIDGQLLIIIIVVVVGNTAPCVPKHEVCVTKENWFHPSYSFCPTIFTDVANCRTSVWRWMSSCQQVNELAYYDLSSVVSLQCIWLKCVVSWPSHTDLLLCITDIDDCSWIWSTM